MDAFHVNTVDTTGAGDSFVGALLCKIVDDQSILEVSAKLRLNKTSHFKYYYRYAFSTVLLLLLLLLVFYCL